MQNPQEAKFMIPELLLERDLENMTGSYMKTPGGQSFGYFALEVSVFSLCLYH